MMGVAELLPPNYEQSDSITILIEKGLWRIEIISKCC